MHIDLTAANPRKCMFSHTLIYLLVLSFARTKYIPIKKFIHIISVRSISSKHIQNQNQNLLVLITTDNFDFEKQRKKTY